MSQTVCSPVSFSGKSGCDSGKREGSATASLHCSCQKSAFQSGTEPPNSSSPRQALPVPNSALQVTLQLQQGPSPNMSNRKVLRSCPPPAREEPAPPGSSKLLTTGLRPPRAEEGSWKSSGHTWPVAKETWTPPCSTVFRD